MQDMLIDYLLAGQQEPEEEPVKEETSEELTASKSLHPNELTAYDTRAVTSLINQDLKERYGKGNFDTLFEENIYFKKKDSLITAEGEYNCRKDGVSETVPFTYTYIDQNTEYLFVGSSNENNITPEMIEEQAKANLSNRQPDRVYDLTVTSSITMDLKHNGEGTMIVMVVDSKGKVVKEAVNQSGYFEKTVTVNVDPGSYQIWLICDDGGWSLYYNSQ